MKEGSSVCVEREYRVVVEKSALHTVTGAIILDEGTIGAIFRRGEIGWIVSFSTGNLRLEVDMPESAIREIS